MSSDTVDARDELLSVFAQIHRIATSPHGGELSSDRVTELVRHAIVFEGRVSHEFVTRNAVLNGYLGSLRDSAVEFASSRKLEGTCPMPGCIQQREHSILVLTMLSQALRSLGPRVLRGRPVDVVPETVLLADCFLVQAHLKVEYECCELSQTEDGRYASRLLRLVGPVDLMAPSDRSDMAETCADFMGAFDAVMDCFRSIEPDLVAFDDVTHRLRSCMSRFRKTYTVFTLKYMTTV